MSKINGYVSIEHVIEKVLRDTDDHESIDIYDAAEWAGEAISKIGFIEAYQFGVATLEIEGYKALLPIGMNNLIAVREVSSGAPIIKSTDIFYKEPSADSSYGEMIQKTYHVNSGAIYVNFSEGEIEIAYTTYPTDERGFPMIPDETHYVAAVVAYIQMKMDYRLWRKGKIHENVKRDSAQDWYHYSSAANVKNHLTIDNMENIFRSMAKIASDQNAYDYLFKYLNIRNVRNY